MNKFSLKYSLCVLFLFIFACISVKPAPQWVSKQPSADQYWFGVGSVEKPYYGSDIRQEARIKAVEEISSQIKIDISASFEHVVSEHNLHLDEYSKSIIQARVDTSVPHTELIDFYETNDRYYLLVRLSQKKYYESIARQRENSIQSALSLLQQAVKKKTRSSYLLVGEAAGEILPYIDFPIETEFPAGSGKKVNLYSHIQTVALQQIQDIQIVPEFRTLEVIAGLKKDQKIIVMINNGEDSTGIANIPVRIAMRGSTTFVSAISDKNGKVIFPIPEFEKNENIQYLEVKVDISDLFGIDIFKSILAVNEEIIVHVIPPQIYIDITELKLEVENSNPFVQPVITEFFAGEMGSIFTDEENADLRIIGEIRTKKTSENPSNISGIDIYQVSCNATITVFHAESRNELVSKSYSLSKEVDYYSFDEAANKALKKISDKIKVDFLPDLIQVLQ